MQDNPATATDSGGRDPCYTTETPAGCVGGAGGGGDDGLSGGNGGSTSGGETPRQGVPNVLSDSYTDTRSIRFTQDTISPFTNLKRKTSTWLDDLADSLFQGWDGEPIDIVYYNGVPYSLDNRRLAAAKILGIRVPVRVQVLTDPEVAAEWQRKATGLQKGTQGLYVDVKGTPLRINMNGSISLRFWGD